MRLAPDYLNARETLRQGHLPAGLSRRSM